MHSIFLALWSIMGATPNDPVVPLLVPGAELYPPSAMAMQEQGIVIITFIVDTDGTPIGCSVSKSSGFPDLDAASCPLVTARSRFAAHDGGPIVLTEAITWSGRQNPVVNFDGAVPIDPQNWIRNEDFLGSAEGTVDIRFDVLPDGSVSNCAVATATADPENDALSCRTMMSRGNFLPAIDEAGRPRVAHARIRIVWQIPTPPARATRIVFDPAQHDDSVCFTQVNGIRRQLTAEYCRGLANAVRSAGGIPGSPIYAKLPSPTPFAVPE